jgi:phosphatidylglycerol lysyltransferase
VPRSAAQLDSLWIIARAARRLAVPLVVLTFGLAAIALFSDLAQSFDYHALLKALRRTPMASIGLSICAAALSFAALVGRDACAVRYVRAQVPLLAPLLAGFCGSALSNAVGIGTLTGAAVRYRIYGVVGVKVHDIARLLLFIAAAFGLGLTGFGALSCLLEAGPVGQLLGWPSDLLRGIAGVTLVGTLGFVLFCLPGTLRIGQFVLAGPGKMLAAAQLALTAIRLAGAAAALWILLPDMSISFFSFVAVFSAATAVSVISNVPGGVGVFEAVVLWALRSKALPDQVVAALLVYRGIYYILPLMLSAWLLAVFEVRLAVRNGPKLQDDPLARTAARLSPSFIGVISFVTGIMLLVSGATPTFGYRLSLLSTHMPLWTVEASHFLGSLLGVVFLFVAKGLFDRRDGAWWLTLLLAVTSLVLSLAKGLAYGEATFLAVFIVLLLATRRQFGRPASMLRQPLALGWFATVGLILASGFLILLFAFHGADYSTGELWWEFEFDAQAPRALRALLGASVLAMSLGLWELLRAPQGLAPAPDTSVIEQAARVIRDQDRSDALLALMGDKSFLFSASKAAFLMFGKRGRSWIALFDPIGPRVEWPELIKRFVELASAHGGRAAFYQVRPDSLPYYLDAGLTVMKLGEEACVQLPSFTLTGGRSTHIRYALKRGERDGLSFELVSPGHATLVMGSLAAISADWLEARQGAEKGFSVAAFASDFLASQWVALVREHGAPVAFATVMTTAHGRDASVGLMRHMRDASPYAMEFLFTKLILGLKELGYSKLSLGMAPLSGVESTPLSSRWHRLVPLIWRHGNRLYNFQGLRAFKDKFNPVWEPRYLAASGTLGPFVALADAVGLIGAAFKGSKAHVANA